MKRTDPIFEDCKHVNLSRENSASMTWYRCAKCREKFEITEFDGKVRLVPADPRGPEITD